jgi:ligand-binding sensor domain-containing protein
MPIFAKNIRVKAVSNRFTTINNISLFLLLLCLITLFLLPIKECSAQQFAFHNYSEDLVPDVGIHHGIIQDSRGIIWIWGSLGVIKYDGSLFQHITKQNGLGSDYVYEIEEAPSGKIYISNFAGISIYDPLTDNISQLDLKLIEPIRVIEFFGENLLVGTDAGLHLIRGKAQYIFELFRRDGSGFVTMPTDILFDDKENMIWVSTDRSGVLSFDYNIILQLFKMKNSELQVELETLGNNKFEEIHPNIINNPEYYVIDDPETRKRMFASLLVEYRSNFPDTEPVITGLIQFPNKQRPFAYLIKQVLRIKGNLLEPIKSKYQPYINHMKNVGKCSGDKLYFTGPNGAYIVDNQEFIHLSKDTGLNSNNVSLFLEDRQGTFWIVMEDGTISHLVTTDIKQYTHRDFPFISNIMKSLKLKEGGAFLAGTSGFSKYENEKLTPLLLPPDIPETIQDISFDKKGNILIVSADCIYFYNLAKNILHPLIEKQDTHQGKSNFTTNQNGDVSVTLSGKLYIWDGSKLKIHPQDFGTMLGYPMMIYTPSDTVTYLGTWDGLARMKHNEKSYYRYNEIFRSTDPTSTIFDRASVHQDSAIITMPEDIIKSNISVHCCSIGPDGVFWAGTFASGIVRIDEDSIRVYDSRNGIPDNQYRTLYKTEDGDLYFIGPHYVAKVSKDSVSMVDIDIPKDITLRTIRNYPVDSWSYATSKGLIIKGEEYECFLNSGFGLNESGVNDLVTTNEDELIVIQSNGFYVIPNNSSFLSSITSYDPIILSLSTESNYFRCDSLVKIPLGERSIGFSYALTDFFNETENRFAWKLDGLYTNFVDHGTKSDVRFFRVPPGKYTFHLKSWNGLGQESSLKTPIIIIVPPHLWETLKFKIFVVILSVALILLFIRWRMNRIQRANIRLEKAVRTRTAELQDALIMLEESQKHRIDAEKLRTAQEMSASIAHEFNNPLAIVLGTYEIYKKKMKENIDEKNILKLEVIPQNIQRMSELVKKLLSITSVKETEYAQGLKMIDLSQSSSLDDENNNSDAENDS